MPELDDLLGESDNDTELVRTLRKALKDKDKEHKELQTQLAERVKTDRSRSLADVLKAKGLPDKIVKLYPAHAEPTAEAVDAWLVEFGDVFGIENAGTTADSGTVDAAKRMAAASAGAPPATQSTDILSLANEIAGARTKDEYDAVLAKLNMAAKR